MTTKTIALFVALLALQAPVPSIPVVELRALASEPQRYDGRQIVISGVFLLGEGAKIYLPSNSAFSINGVEPMFVVLAPAVLRNPGELENQYLERSRNISFVVATAEGRFTVPSQQVGHLGCCRFQFEITKIISLDCTPPAEAQLGRKQPC